MAKQNRNRALLEASERGDVQAIRAMAPVDLSCTDELGDTPLILAARNGHDELVRFLLEQGADAGAMNLERDDALIAASERAGNAAVLKLLIDAGAQINRTNRLGRTALITAASIGDGPDVDLLLQYRPDLNVVTGEEETALTFAIVNTHPDVAKSLIDAGADVSWTDSKGWTPLIYAVYAAHVEIVRLLLDAGADPDHADRNGDSTLIHAVRSGNAAVVREILKKTSEPAHRGHHGMTALDHADQSGMEEIRRLLREALSTG